MARRNYLWVLLLLFAFCVIPTIAQTNEPLAPYDDPEAYKVYSAILPQELKANDPKSRTIVIQAETESFANCIQLADDAASDVREAVVDYSKQNEKKWLLQRSLDLNQPYLFITSDEIKTLFSGTGDGWAAFFSKYPDSGGYIEVSAVGFNADKTVAVVYVGHHCHYLCGGGTQQILEKIDGRWQPARIKAKGGCSWFS